MGSSYKSAYTLVFYYEATFCTSLTLPLNLESLQHLECEVPATPAQVCLHLSC